MATRDDRLENAFSPPISSVGRNAFVGRQREFEELKAGLADLQLGRGRLFLISGEPGIGKTRLADELAKLAGSGGFRTVWGRCWEGGGAPAFWPWVQILRSCMRDRKPNATGSQAAAIMSELGTLAPELTNLFLTADSSPQFDPPTTPLPPLSSDEPDTRRFRLFDAISGFLQDLSRVEPLVIIIDDCHAADVSSILFLQFVARVTKQAPLLLLATYREIEVRLAPHLTTLFGELARDGQQLSLRGLSESDVAAYLVTNIRRSPELAVVKALYAATEGNPFFLSEIVRLMIAEENLPDSAPVTSREFTIPAEVHIAIRRRLDLVSEPARDLLRTASVIGREFQLEVITRASGVSGARIVEQLSEAVAAGLITEASSLKGRYRFSHALISGTLYEDLPESLRQQLHVQIAEALESLYAANLQSHLSELAYHNFRALPAVDAIKAVDHGERAAQRAEELLSYEEAIDLYRMTIRVLKSQPPFDEQRYCRLVLALGGVLNRAGLFDDARVAFREAREIANRLGKPDFLSQAALGFATLATDPGFVDLAKVEILEEALKAQAGSQNSLHAMLLARLAWELHWSHDEARRTSLSREAVELSRKIGDTSTLIYVLIHRHLAVWGPDNLDERLSISAELEQLCRQPLTRFLVPQALYLRIADLLELGDIQAADEAIENSDASKDKIWLAFGFKERAQAVRALIEGRFKDAEGLATQALTLGQHIPGRARTAFVDHLLALRREQGRLDEIAGPIRDLVGRFPHLVYARCGWALCLCELGQRAEARAEFERLAADDFSAIPRIEIWLPAIAMMAEVCASIGDTSRAKVLYQFLLPYAARNIMSGINACYGSASHYLGILALTLEQFDQAEVHFEAAQRFSRRTGARPLLARTQYECAKMLLRQAMPGERRRATELIVSAITSARELGMNGLVEKARLLLPKPREITEEDERIASGTADVLPSGVSRVLATILFADIVGSTERASNLGDRRWGQLLDNYYSIVRERLAEFDGREMGTAGDGFLAIFETPLRAIHCALGIQESVRSLDLNIRAGLHAGECELGPKEVRGIAVHIGARVAAAAAPGEVLVSHTVKELMAGGEVKFGDRGTHVLKGVSGQWHLFCVQSTD